MKSLSPLAAVMSAILVLSGCSAGKHGDSTLTIVSYNVGVFNKYVPDSAPQVAAILKAEGAGLVGLCELDSCAVRTGNRDELAELVGLLGNGWHHAFCSAMPYGGGAYGVGLCTNGKVLDSFQIHLPKGDGSEPRACQVVETPECWFAVTHLDYTKGTARMEQARMVSETLKQRCGGHGKPVVLCGDFNAAPDSETIQYMSRDWDIVSSPEASFPSQEPKVCIDYIMVLKGSADYEVLTSEVIGHSDAADVQTASDHLPSLVKLKITSAAR